MDVVMRLDSSLGVQALLFKSNSKQRNSVFLTTEERVFEQVLFTWMAAGDFTAEFGFQVDPLSMTMMLFVTGVGFLIHVYSIGYMHEEYSFYRFFAYMNLFMCSMLLLVMGIFSLRIY